MVPNQPQQQPRALCGGAHENIRMSADLSNDVERWPNIQSMNGHFSTLYTEGLKWWKVYCYHLKGIRDDGLHSELFVHQFLIVRKFEITERVTLSSPKRIELRLYILQIKEHNEIFSIRSFEIEGVLFLIHAEITVEQLLKGVFVNICLLPSCSEFLSY